MFIELHILQNFAPSNLNRDETGAPKSCLFGDVPRARVSSQALKRATRDYVEKYKLLDPKILGKRSKLIEGKLKKLLEDSLLKKLSAQKLGIDERLVSDAQLEDFISQVLHEDKEQVKNQAGFLANFVLKESGWKKENETEESGALQFLGNKTLNDIAKLCNEEWELFQDSILLNDEKQRFSQEKKDLDKKKKAIEKEVNKNPTAELQTHLSAKEKEIEENKTNLEKNEAATKEAQKKVTGVIKKIRDLLGAKQTPDIAMFGRMMADVPEHSIDAASQVAHAISTHAVSSGEFDYFTALDEFKKELKPNADAGAAMIGTVDFNSACYYRFASIDLNSLKDNLKHADNSEDLARKTVEAFLQSFVIAVPSGKKNSFASPTLPSLVLGVIRQGYLCSLANAFSKPIRLRDDDENGLIEKSIEQMTKHFCNQERMYGKTVGTKYGTFCCESPEFVVMPKESDKTSGDVSSNHKVKFEESDSLEELIENLTKHAFDQPNGE